LSVERGAKGEKGDIDDGPEPFYIAQELLEDTLITRRCGTWAPEIPSAGIQLAHAFAAF